MTSTDINFFKKILQFSRMLQRAFQHFGNFCLECWFVDSIWSSFISKETPTNIRMPWLNLKLYHGSATVDQLADDDMAGL